MPATAIDRPFGPYHLTHHLGDGGMASVWLAVRTGHDEAEPHVVLKTIKGALREDPQIVAMFLQEATVGLQLTHPNLVEVIDLGMIDGHPYIEMEYCRGRTLRSLLCQQPAGLSIELALAVMIDACHGLAAMHVGSAFDGHSYFVHRDISPENVIVGFDGVAKILDFGIATTPESTFTEPGIRKGKIRYMAPEALAAGSVGADKRQDIYGLGTVLYESVTGNWPFPRGVNTIELMAGIMRGVEERPQARRPDIPDALDAIIMTALAPNPDRRFPDALHLAQALDAVLRTIDARPRHMIARTALAAPRSTAGRKDFSVHVAIDSAVEAPPQNRRGGIPVAESVVPFPATESRLRRRAANQHAAMVLFEEGLRLQAAGQIEAAARVWQEALALHPDHDTIADNLAILQRRREAQENRS